MNEAVKEIITPSLHSEIKQIAPYVVAFDDRAMYTRTYLISMAKATGSLFKPLGETPDGKSLFRISDPLCKILEETGVNA